MLLGIIFLNTELNKPHFMRDEMMFMHCSLQKKAKNILNRHFPCYCSDQMYKKYKEKSKKVPYLKVCHFSISRHFPNVKAVVVQAVIA